MSGVVLFLLFLLCSGLAVCFLQKGNETPEEPVILGMVDITVEQGSSLPDLKDRLSMNDAVETVVIDTSKVDLQKPGEYPVCYRYTDTSGQIYEKTVCCTVMKAEEKRQEGEKTGETGIIVFRQNIPKTRDTASVFGYVLLFGCSLAGCGISICHILQPDGRRDRKR